MAQHINADLIDNSKVQKIIATIRANKYFKTSMKFSELPYDEYKESPDDEVYTCSRVVPASVVWGRRAFFEVHTKPAPNMAREVTNIFMVV